MKFKMRTSYEIFGKKVKIKMIDTMEYAGLYDPIKEVIYINKRQPPDEILATLWHEIIHCIQYQTGIDQAVPRELLEVMAETGSRAIVSIIKKS